MSGLSGFIAPNDTQFLNARANVAPPIANGSLFCPVYSLYILHNFCTNSLSFEMYKASFSPSYFAFISASSLVIFSFISSIGIIFCVLFSFDIFILPPSFS